MKISKKTPGRKPVLLDLKRLFLLSGARRSMNESEKTEMTISFFENDYSVLFVSP